MHSQILFVISYEVSNYNYDDFVQDSLHVKCRKYVVLFEVSYMI